MAITTYPTETTGTAPGMRIAVIQRAYIEPEQARALAAAYLATEPAPHSKAGYTRFTERLMTIHGTGIVYRPQDIAAYAETMSTPEALRRAEEHAPGYMARWYPDLTP